MLQFYFIYGCCLFVVLSLEALCGFRVNFGGKFGINLGLNSIE